MRVVKKYCSDVSLIRQDALLDQSGLSVLIGLPITGGESRGHPPLLGVLPILLIWSLIID